MKKIIISLSIVSVAVFYLTSCYSNKSDISLPDKTVSFSKDVIPIFTSGPCGCHNTNGATNTLGSNNAVRFSNGNFNGTDTILYDAILARVSVMQEWVNGGKHPGGGDVYLTPLEQKMIKDWIAQGAQDDSNNTPSGNTITYSKDIASIISGTCSGSSCHGGVAVLLNYNKLTSDNSILNSMVAAKGASGHPGGKLSLSANTWNTLKGWIDAGMPQ